MSTTSSRKCKPHYICLTPTDPEVKSWKDWPKENHAFHDAFQEWLKGGGYSDSAILIYSAAARMALGYLVKPFHQIDIAGDISRVQQYLAGSHRRPATKHLYQNGIIKLTEYLLSLVAPNPQKRIHPIVRGAYHAPGSAIQWDYYCRTLPDWLIDDLKAYIRLCRRNWRPERQHRATIELLSHLSIILRWMVQHGGLETIADITPERWHQYVKARSQQGIGHQTLINELYRLQSFLRFLAEEGRTICSRIQYVKGQKAKEHQYRDAPVEQIRLILGEIEKLTQSENHFQKRLGLMDKAWFLLMLYGGLRTGEVRFLKLEHIDWENRRVKIEMSKGFRERLVYLSDETASALKEYLVMRGEVMGKSWVFLYRSNLLSYRYCQVRMRTYSKRCDVRISPHQLRFTCATLMLNSGIPIATIQKVLGHQNIDTTLRYAQLYEDKMASDFSRLKKSSN